MAPTRSNTRRRAAAKTIWQKAYTLPAPAQMRILEHQKKLCFQSDRLAREVIAPRLRHANIRTSTSSWPLGLMRYQIVQLWNEGMPDQDDSMPMMGVYQDVVEHYIELLCHHVNLSLKRARGMAPACVTWGDEYWCRLKENGFRDVTRILNADNLQAGNFTQVRQIFIPVAEFPDYRDESGNKDEDEVGHSWLLVISPSAKRIELLNSGSSPLCTCILSASRYLSAGLRTNSRNKKSKALCRDTILASALQILAAHLGRSFIPHEWRVRTDRSPTQGNSNDCGVFTMSAAMHIAFGYAGVPQGVDMEARRMRIASEILNYDRVSDAEGKGGMAGVKNTRSHFASIEDFDTSQAAVRDPFYYPIYEPHTVGREEGWHRISPCVLSRLPASVRNMRRRYENIRTKKNLRLLSRERGDSKDVSEGGIGSEPR